MVCITAAFPKLPGKVENPALQNAETEWKAAKYISCCNVIPRVLCIEYQIITIPIPSIANVNPRIYNKVDKREFNELELIISPTTS